MDFENKVVVITGAAQGIGRSIAEKFAQKKANVIIGDINLEKAKKAEASIRTHYGIDAVAVQMDVSDLNSTREAFNAIIAKYDKIDILVNNAGICKPLKAFEEIGLEEWNEVIEVNLLGTINCINAVIPIMKRNQYGKIINIASLAGETGGIAVSPSYAVSKAGVICLTKSLAQYLGKYNINVNAIAPGFIKTDMTANLNQSATVVPLKRFGEIDDVSNAALFMASEESKYITGSTVDVNGGLYMK